MSMIKTSFTKILGGKNNEGCFQPITIEKKYIHLSFSSLEFNLLSLVCFIGLNLARTCINCLKFTRSLQPSSKKAWTILSPRGLIASSGIRRKSSRLKVPQSPLSKLVNLLYNLSIWLGVTATILNI